MSRICSMERKKWVVIKCVRLTVMLETSCGLTKTDKSTVGLREFNVSFFSVI